MYYTMKKLEQRVKGIQASILLILLACLTACGSQEQTKASPAYSLSRLEAFEYRKVSQKDLDEVQQTWKSRDLSVQDYELVLTHKTDAHTVEIVKHRISGKVHYGAIVIPKIMPQKKLPVIVMTDGLNQMNPSLNLDQHLMWNQGNPLLTKFIQVYPAFRGRVLLYQGLSLFSEGEFSDAYDGAADDAIAMLNLAEATVPQGKYDKVVVRGGSRGGNTALLLAARDQRVNTVISVAGPVDFYREEVRARYGDQYIWQFFQDKTENEARQKMLASSPIYFAPLDSVEHISLLHGKEDMIVPAWNSSEMEAYLLSHDKKVTAQYYSGANHFTLYQNEDFLKQLNTPLERFLNHHEGANTMFSETNATWLDE